MKDKNKNLKLIKFLFQRRKYHVLFSNQIVLVFFFKERHIKEFLKIVAIHGFLYIYGVLLGPLAIWSQAFLFKDKREVFT